MGIRLYGAGNGDVRFARAVVVVALFLSLPSMAEGPTLVGSEAWSVRPDLSTTYPYTDDPLLTQSTPVRRIHVTELRVAVDTVRQQAGLVAFPWTDPQPTHMRAVHVMELRSALAEAFTALKRPAPVWSDPIVPGGTIRARHFQEIRDRTRWEASGTITTDTTWLASNSPYVVQGEVTVNLGATLTIAPGTIVKFATGARLQVLEGSTLIANGTPTQPIFFTSLKDDTVGGDTNRDGDTTLPARGDWGILAIGNPVAQNNLPAFGSITHAGIRYGGQFIVRFSAPTLNNLSSTYMSGDGLYLESPPAGSYTIERLTLTDNVTNLALVNVHGSTTIQKCIVRRASGVAIRAIDNTAAHLVDNSIDENRGSVAVQATNSPLVLHYNSITRNHPQDGVARGVTTTGALIDARYNWWGSVTGPTHVVDGKGQVGADTDVDPWLGKDWAAAFRNGDHPWALKAGISVDVASGNFYLAERDLVIATVGFPLEITRTYNSKAAVEAESDFGFGWTWNYGTRLRPNAAAYGVVWQREDGTETYLKRNPDDTFSAEEGLYEKLVQLSSGAYRLTRKDQSVLIFSSDGYLTAQVDASGNTTTITRDGSGHVVRVTEPLGRELTVEYSGGYITKITDPLERTFRYERNPNGAVASVVMRDRLGTTFGTANYFYGPGGRWEMLGVEDVDGNLIDQSFDSSKRVAQQRFNNSAPVSFVYCDWNTAGCSPQGVTVIEDMRDRLHEYHYTPSNKVTDHFRQQVVSGGGYEVIHDDAWTYTGYLIATHVGLKGTTESTYDWDTGNLTKLVEPGGRTTTYTYDGFNNRTSTTDHLGRVTRYEYDANQRLIRTTDALDRITQHEYDARGLLVRTTDPLGRVTSFDYDQFGYPRHTVNALGQGTEYSFDVGGRKLSETNARAEKVTWTYDSRGNPLEITDPLGNRTSYTYDLKGRKVEVRDAEGRSTKFAYSETKNELVKTTDALGGTVELTRDDFGGNITAIKDARGNVTSFVYDDLNRRTSETDPLGRTWRFAYLRGDLLQNMTDGKGRRTDYLYDSSNRLAHINYPDGTSSSNTYDGVGNRTSLVDWTGETSWSYDALNRVVEARKNGQVTAYGYDAVGNLLTLTYPGSKTVTYTYDELNHLTAVKDWDNRTTSYLNYDLAGRLKIFTYPNGMFAIHEHDAAGRLTGIQYTRQGATLRGFSYEYDRVGNRKLRRNRSTDVAEESYLYDELYRVKLAYYADTATYVDYAYDADGNRTLRREQVGDNPSTTVISAYDGADQLLTDGAWTRAYDGNGAQIVDGPRSFSWNEQHLLSSISSSTTTAFTYDADGRRVRQSVNGVATDYVVNTVPKLPEVLMETTAGASTYYIYGHDLLYTIGPGGPRYLHGDAIGSTLAGSDGAGQEVAQYRYDVFGAVTSATNSGWTRRRFTGEENDDSGLVYLRARYYDPGMGRFISRDSFPMDAMDTQSVNRYVYVKNNPTNCVDPSGEVFDVAVDLAFVAYDVYDIWQTISRGERPSATQAGVLGADLLATALPFVTGAGAAVRTATVAGQIAPSTYHGIGATRVVGEQYLRTLGGASQVFYDTPLGARYIDQVVNGTAYEAKVGYTALSRRVTRQVAKDAVLLRSGSVNAYTWYFFRSPTTGVIGPSGALRNELQRNGIRVIIR